MQQSIGVFDSSQHPKDDFRTDTYFKSPIVPNELWDCHNFCLDSKITKRIVNESTVAIKLVPLLAATSALFCISSHKLVKI